MDTPCISLLLVSFLPCYPSPRHHTHMITYLLLRTATHASLRAALPTNVDEGARRPTRVSGPYSSTRPRHRLGCIAWCSRGKPRAGTVVWTQCRRSALRYVTFPSYPPIYPTDLVPRTLVDIYPYAAMACLSLQAARPTREEVCGFALARRPRRYAIALASVFGARLVAWARCVVVAVAVVVKPLAGQGAHEPEIQMWGD